MSKPEISWISGLCGHDDAQWIPGTGGLAQEPEAGPAHATVGSVRPLTAGSVHTTCFRKAPAWPMHLGDSILSHYGTMPLLQL